MHDYIEPFPTCDQILKIFVEDQHHRMDQSNIYNSLSGNTNVRSAFQHLIDEECLVHDPYPYYLLNGKGAQLYANGGYKALLERLKLADEFKRQLDEANLNMSRSVERTNKAMVKNIRRNNTIIVLTLIVAAIGAFGTLGSFIAGYEQRKPEQPRLLPNSLQPPKQFPQLLLRDTPNLRKTAKDSLTRK
jgi:hypothetical protein